MSPTLASFDKLGDRLVVASVSGGKDSTALALALHELEVPHVRVFADTGSARRRAASRPTGR